MQFKNIAKFPDHCPIFMEVIDKKNVKQTDKFTTCRLKNFLEQDPHEAEIFPTEKKIIKIGAFFEKKIGE